MSKDDMEARLDELERMLSSIEGRTKINMPGSDLEERVRELEAVQKRKETVKELKLKAATSVPIDVNSRHIVISGKRLSPGDIVHVKNQRISNENGYYQVQQDFMFTKLG